MVTSYINATTGQLIRFVIQTLNADGYREDGYTPIVDSVIFPDLSLADNYPTEMTRLTTGLYAHGIELPSTGVDALGTYIANVYYQENGASKWDVIVVNVTRPFGNSSVSAV